MEYATPLLFLVTTCLVFILGIILGRMTMFWTMKEYADMTNIPVDIADAMRIKTIGDSLVVMYAHSFGSTAQSLSSIKREMYEQRAETVKARDNFMEMVMERDRCLETIEKLQDQLNKKRKGESKKE